MLLRDICNTGWHMDCLLPPLTTIQHGTWKCPLCIPHHLLPQTATQHLRLPSPILDFDSDSYKHVYMNEKDDSLSLIRVSRLPITIYQKKNVFPNTPTRIPEPNPHARLFRRGQSLKPNFGIWLVRSSPWGDLGPRHRRFSPPGFFLGFFFMGTGPCGPVPPLP